MYCGKLDFSQLEKDVVFDMGHPISNGCWDCFTCETVFETWIVLFQIYEIW